MKKIQFYKERSFSEKISATINFLNQNLRYVWRYLLYATVPTGMVTGLLLNWFYYWGVTGNISASYGVLFLALLVVAYVGYSYLFGLIFSIMQLYNDRENGLEGITYADLKPYMKDNVKRMHIYLLGLILYVIAMVLVFIIPIVLFKAIGGIISLGLLFIGLVVYQLVLPVYLNENISYLDAIPRGIRLAWNTFGGVLLLMFVVGIIVQVISTIFGLPWYIFYGIKVLFLSHPSSDSIATAPWFSILTYVFGMIMSIGNFASSIIMVIAMNYQYSNAAEQEDSFSIDEEIDDFDQL